MYISEPFDYYLYGHRIRSNIQFFYLTTYCNQKSLGDIFIYVAFQNRNEEMEILSYLSNTSDKYEKLQITNDIIYYVSENWIVVISTDLNKVESTLLNIPFALILQKRNMLLLHASCLQNEGVVVPLCAPKGVGKTTLSLFLSNKFDFFSDDTAALAFKEGLQVHSGISYAKLTKETYDAYNISVPFCQAKKNLQGKAYQFIASNTNRPTKTLKIKSIFFLNRVANKNAYLEKVLNGFTKKILLHTNICGTNYLGYEYCKSIEKNIVFNQLYHECEFYKLNVPNDIQQVKNSIYIIRELIEQVL